MFNVMAVCFSNECTAAIKNGKNWDSVCKNIFKLFSVIILVCEYNYSETVMHIMLTRVNKQLWGYSNSLIPCVLRMEGDK